MRTLEQNLYANQIKLYQLQSQKNQIVAQIPKATTSQKIAFKNQTITLNQQIDQLKTTIKQQQIDFENMWYQIPNLVDPKVPQGQNANDNVILTYFGSVASFDFPIQPHWDLALNKKLCSYTQATTISGAKFVVYKNLGAKLLRALSALSLDFYAQFGYVEFLMPIMVQTQSLYVSGQLPKFSDDVFAISNSNFYLSPTLEVQLVNLLTKQILNANQLPLKYMASGINFRKEAGSGGLEHRGNIRLHQFNKTELVNITTPQDSNAALEQMRTHVCELLQALALPFRVVLLCGSDLGFSSAITYDIEVYLPSRKGYCEIASISNCYDFQARRGLIRYRDLKQKKNVYVHTLNGTGLALDRVFAALLENHQTKDGLVNIPSKL